MKTLELATFGGGCFWCIEAIMQRLKGVEKIVSGYSGGTAPGTPTYREVCIGLTGHAEVVQVSFDPSELNYEDLITIFMTSHDPTTLNRQGGDSGTQYHSVIFYHSEEQKVIAEKVLNNLAEYYEDPIVTELTALDIFYPAELSHQNYYNDNSEAGFCTAVIAPKLSKLRNMYSSRLKD